MAIEQGIVIKLDKNPETAWVKTKTCSACESCSVRNSCNEAGKIEERQVQAINAAGAKVGDRIQLSISTGSLLKATFLLYLFPVICMLIGGLTGNAIAGNLFIDSPLVSICAALLCLAAAMVFVRFRGTKLAARSEYRPKIIRVIGRHRIEDTRSGQAESRTAEVAEQNT
jgi:sigma-E factor negative regulatory protein RseC